MTEWGVVGVVIALVGLFVTVVKPLLTLNTSIVELSARMKHISGDLKVLTDDNSKNHARIWDRMDEHGDIFSGDIRIPKDRSLSVVSSADKVSITSIISIVLHLFRYVLVAVGQGLRSQALYIAPHCNNCSSFQA